MVSAERGYDMFRFVSQDVGEEEEGDVCTFLVSTKLAIHWMEEGLVACAVACEEGEPGVYWLMKGNTRRRWNS
jgi:hypothetical protein